MGRRGGGGYPGGQTGGNRGGANDSAPAPVLQLRWESALSVRAADLKAHEANAPTVNEGHYAIAVYGVPDGWSRVVSKVCQVS